MSVPGMEADDNDHDSTFGGSRASLAESTVSLQSEVTRYEWENGRRYHGYKAGQYHFPNDERELNRMDIEHFNQRAQMNGRLHLCPLDEPLEILDLGTGTGLWCIAMADTYTNAQVRGTDLSPVQPTWVPPNCRFEVDDFELDWTWGHNRFDMIHQQFLIGSISDHKRFYEQVYDALRPGGYIELIEMEAHTFSDDNSLPPAGPQVKWGHMIHEAFGKMGRPFLPVEQYKKHLEDAGFEDIHFQMVKRPTNDWPKDPKMKEIGKFCCLNFLEGLEGFSMAPFTRVLGWTPEEVAVLIAQVRRDTLKRSIHGWMKACVCYGRKPLHPTQPKSDGYS